MDNNPIQFDSEKNHFTFFGYKFGRIIPEGFDVGRLLQIRDRYRYYLATYTQDHEDVVSLFHNTPLEETIVYVFNSMIHSFKGKYHRYEAEVFKCELVAKLREYRMRKDD
jgi:hypothetical protein